jgi:hypothetical protein
MPGLLGACADWRRAIGHRGRESTAVRAIRWWIKIVEPADVDRKVAGGTPSDTPAAVLKKHPPRRLPIGSRHAPPASPPDW